MVWRVMVQVAPSARSTCHQCKQKINEGDLRFQIQDNKQFLSTYMKLKNKGMIDKGQGFYRGYFQLQGNDGKCISVKKYYIHPHCYQPKTKKKWQRQNFDYRKLKAMQRQDFLGFIEVRRIQFQQTKAELKQIKKIGNKIKKTKEVKN